jgi:putative membrane protein
MRAFGLYRLDFETAGQSGPGALVSMLGIVDAIAFRASILEQRDRLAEAQNAKAPEPADQDKLTALLASVRNIERILEERTQAQ